MTKLIARCAWSGDSGIAERVERLCEEPGLVLDRLADMRSVWNAADVEREVRSILGVRDGYDAAVRVATQAITEASLRLDVDAYTLERVVVEERAVFDAATTLAERRRDVGLRGPAAELDAQQQAAYAHLAGERDLTIVTGIAGAGNHVCSATLPLRTKKRAIASSVRLLPAMPRGRWEKKRRSKRVPLRSSWRISRRGAIAWTAVAS